MSQFDVYENMDPKSRATIPFLLDLQCDLLKDLNTRVVAPLITTSAQEKGIKVLNPKFEISAVSVMMSTAEIAGVSVRLLGSKVGSLEKHRSEILAALDFLFTGY